MVGWHVKEITQAVFNRMTKRLKADEMWVAMKPESNGSD
jgi:hypothetical protein